MITHYNASWAALSTPQRAGFYAPVCKFLLIIHSCISRLQTIKIEGLYDMTSHKVIRAPRAHRLQNYLIKLFERIDYLMMSFSEKYAVFLALIALYFCVL